MNSLIAGSAVRALVMVGTSFVVGKGWATSAEVSDFVSQGTNLVSGAIALATAAYSIYTRTTNKQIQMTESLPKVDKVVKKAPTLTGF